MSVNSITVSGTVGKVGTPRKAGNADCVDVSIAHVTHKDGPTCWVKATFFGLSMERAMTLKPGELVVVSGPFRYTEYTGKDGVKKQSIEVTPSGGQFERLQRTAPAAAKSSDDDLPFQ